MSDNPLMNLTDTMIHVSSVSSESKFFMDVLGMEEIERSDDAVILESPATQQRVTLVSTNFESQFSLAIASQDLRESLRELESLGCRVTTPKKSESGFEYALCMSPAGVPLMLYSAE